MQRKRDIEIKDTAFDPKLKGKKVHVQGIGSEKPMYKVWLYLEGRGLAFVQSVTYKLHPTFANPIKNVKRTPSNPNCTMIIWTWGIFMVKATIRFLDGEEYVIEHNLQYGNQLNSEKWEYAGFHEK